MSQDFLDQTVQVIKYHFASLFTCQIILPSLYKVEFVLTPETLSFNPDLDQFRDSIGEIMQQFKETLLQVENLVPDKYFDAFTRWDLNIEFNLQT